MLADKIMLTDKITITKDQVIKNGKALDQRESDRILLAYQVTIKLFTTKIKK